MTAMAKRPFGPQRTLRYRGVLCLVLFSGMISGCTTTESNLPAGTERTIERKQPAPQEEEPRRSKKRGGKETPAEPLPERVRIEAPNQGPPAPGREPRYVDKDMFNIAVSNKSFVVNAVRIDDLEALEALLAKYDRPVVALATHICLSTARAGKILSTVQQYTDTPIAFGSFGEYGDEECGN